jgi:hypothetical protein
MAISRTKQRSRTSRQLSRTAAGRNDDRPLVASQPYKLEYLRKRLPKATRRRLEETLNDCTAELKTDDRQQIMSCLKKKLGNPRG